MTPLHGNNYYRIVVKEKDGNYVSKVIVIKNGLVKNSFGVVQLGNNLNLQLQGVAAGEYKMMLLNSNGQLLKSATILHDGTDVIKQINIGNLRVKGLYKLVLHSVNNTLTQSVILQ